MKEYSKYIFDEDYTLLIPDWSMEDDFFRSKIHDNIDELISKKADILTKYEANFKKYSYEDLSNYFKSFGFNLTPNFIKEWMIFNGEHIVDTIPDSLKDLFKYLKSNNKEIVVLTNWFGECQINRLKRSGLYDYVDDVISGDISIKPNKRSFDLAIGNTPRDECIMIGDSVKTDVLGAINSGIDYYLVDKEHSISDLYNSIKKDKKKLIR